MVVDDELGATVEHVDQADGPVGTDQNVVGQLDHRQSAALRGDRIQLAGGGLLTFAQFVEFGAPGSVIDHRRQGRGFGGMASTFALDLFVWKD